MGCIDCEEPTKIPCIHCKFFPSALKDVLAQCHVFSVGRRSSSSIEDENSASDIEDDQVIILAVRSRAMEAKLRRKDSSTTDQSLCWVLSPVKGELFAAPKGGKDEDYDADEDTEAFFSARSCLSRSSSMSRVEWENFRRQSLIEEFCQLEGWPFGLYRKMLLLPPLPRCPSDSWKWYRGNPMVKMSW